MQDLLEDILKEIFSKLDPVDYRNLRQTCKKFFRISLSPLKNYIIYKGVYGPASWMMKVDRLGNCLSLIIPGDSNLLKDGIFKMGTGPCSFECEITSGGYLEGSNLTLEFKPKDKIGSIDNFTVNLTFKKGKANGPVKMCVPGYPPRTFEYSEGILQDGTIPVAGWFCNPIGFYIKYNANKLTELRYGIKDIQIQLHDTEGYYLVRQGYDIKQVELSEILCYLPFFLTSRDIPIRGNKLKEVVLPLRISSCRHQRDAQTKVEHVISRFNFYISSSIASMLPR